MKQYIQDPVEMQNVKACASYDSSLRIQGRDKNFLGSHRNFSQKLWNTIGKGQ